MHKISNWVVCVNGNHPRAYMKGSVIFRLVSLGGVYWENSHRRESHTGMTFWFCIAFTWWLGHFISRYLKVHFMLIKYMCVIQNCKHYTCATRSSLPADRFHTETGGHFALTRYRCEIRTGVKFSPRYKNRDELTPGCLTPAWHFVVVSCKQI